MKGNTSRRSFIDQNNHIYSKIHLKLSFEETFDDPLFYTKEEQMSWDKEAKKAREDRKFLDMSKLDLRYNRLEDQSHIKEYYALEMFRDYGILSQHSNFGNITLHQDGKDVHYGLFLVTEPLTKTLIKRSLNHEKYLNMGDWDTEKSSKYGVPKAKYGQFYKASYGLGSTITAPNMTSYEDRWFGVEPDDASNLPPYELKSNEDSNDHSQIKKMIQTLNEGSLEEIEKLIDMEYFITYEAIATLLGCPDDLRNNYNNYAMYFRRTDGKMVLIPIDLDRVLGVAREYDPSGKAMSNVSPLEPKAVGANQNQANPLYYKVLMSSKYQKVYLDKVKEISESKWFTEEHFNSIYEIVKNHYEKIEDDFQKVAWSLDEVYETGNKNMSFKEYRKRKLETIEAALHPKDQPSETTNIIANCTHFYLTGTMDNWNKTTKEYQLIEKEKGIYTIAYTIEEGHFECKIYTTDEGGMWLRADNDEVLHEHGNNLVFDFAKSDAGKKLVFIVNTITGTIHYEITD